MIRGPVLWVLAALALLAAGPVTVETVGGTRAAIMLPGAAPVGSIILVPGGTTLLKIAADGTSKSRNFVMRIRPQLLGAGFALAYVDDPSDLQPIIARMRAVKRPVFLLATSNGTGVAANAAATLGAAGPDGVMLTSTVTRNSREVNRSAEFVDYSKIAVPVLFVHNTNDTCAVSPPSGVAPLMARFPAGADVTRIDVTSAVTGSDPCEAAAAHAYVGIEADVAAKIVAWMRAHGAS